MVRTYRVDLSVIAKLWHFILFCVYPPYCATCRVRLMKRTILCMSCYQRISPVVSSSIRVGQSYIIPVLAISRYQDPLRSLILAKGRSDITAAHQLGQLMWQLTYVKERPIDYVIPIPLHWSRYAWRGYNQAHEIAKVLARNSGAQVAHLVRRKKKTRFQAGLSVEHRVRNVSKAFVLNVANKELYRDKHLVLVDDLLTTGSTVQAAARELARLKPASITVVVACRVV